MIIKDLTYPPQDAARDKSFVAVLLANASIDPGTYSRIGNLLLQVLNGAQLWVTKDVSDDLQASDLDPDEVCFEEVDWPGDRLEVYFEDPSIPTFLAARSTDQQQHEGLEKALGRKIACDDRAREVFAKAETFISLQAEDHEGSMISVTYRPADIDRFVRGDELPEHKLPSSPVATGMSDAEREEMKNLAMLLFKVLLFASSEGHTIRRTRDRPTKKQGGKPGFKNRPVTDRLIVEYLPRHLAEKKQAAETERKQHHQFLGRRGHWRRFRSARFVNVQGQRRFIYPIPGPDGAVPRRKFVLKNSAPK